MSLPLEKIPTPKAERWKYTNLQRALKKMDLKPASLGWGGNVSLISPHAPGAAQYGDTQLWDLNTAVSQDIRFIGGNDDVSITAQDGQWLSPRLIIHVKAGETVHVTERHAGQGAYWKNAVVQIVLEKNARLHHTRFIEEAAEAVGTIFTHIKLARDAHYEGFTLISGAGAVRNQIHAEIQGENGYCGLAGVNLLTGGQLADTTITIEHQAPNGFSNQTYKSVLDDKAHGVFQGKVHVHRVAQKTDGYQLSNTLLLSPLAQMDTKPELEIYADDVKCSHGATTGQLDEEPLFYMRARGIPLELARALLIESFCGAAVDKIADEPLRDETREKVRRWLTSRA